LLFATRQEIEKYAVSINLEYRVDSTNSYILYRRNRIRRVLLPMLVKEFNPQIISSLNRLGANLAEVEDYLDHETKTMFRNCLKFKDEHKIILDINDYLAYFKILQKGILALSLEHLGTDARILDFALNEKISRALPDRQNGYTFSVTEGINITIYENELIIWRQEAEWQALNIPALPGKYSFGNQLIFEIKRAEKPLDFQNKSRNTEWIDADKIVEPLTLRSVIAGDRFYPVNFRGSKKVSDYFIDEKIPVYERRQIPILACKTGIIWLVGKRLDERFKVSDKTARIYKHQIKKAE
jgi:tRNA(Ile)-lysidine synthase